MDKMAHNNTGCFLNRKYHSIAEEMRRIKTIWAKVRKGKLLTEIEERYWELYIYDAKTLAVIITLSAISITLLTIMIIRSL